MTTLKDKVTDRLKEYQNKRFDRLSSYFDGIPNVLETKILKHASRGNKSFQFRTKYYIGGYDGLFLNNLEKSKACDIAKSFLNKETFKYEQLKPERINKRWVLKIYLV